MDWFITLVRAHVRRSKYSFPSDSYQKPWDVTTDERLARSYLDKLDRCHVYDRRTFIKGVIITTEVSEDNISLECRAFLKHHGNEWVKVRVEDGKHTLAPGPYVYLEESLRRIYRLYDDRQGAFMCGIKPPSDPWDPVLKPIVTIYVLTGAEDDHQATINNLEYLVSRMVVLPSLSLHKHQVWLTTLRHRFALPSKTATCSKASRRHFATAHTMI